MGGVGDSGVTLQPSTPQDSGVNLQSSAPEESGVNLQLSTPQDSDVSLQPSTPQDRCTSCFGSLDPHGDEDTRPHDMYWTRSISSQRTMEER
jgi:hypothetical protein